MNLILDKPLPQEINKPWLWWKKQIPLLEEVKMKRCIINQEEKSIKDSTILAFGDASETAYGCCAYLMTTYEDDTVSSSLIFAKSRVNPIGAKNGTKLTIVRLELVAALCTSRSADYTSKALDVNNTICSTIVLLFCASMCGL